jgi:hypothetical protein
MSGVDTSNLTAKQIHELHHQRKARREQEGAKKKARSEAQQLAQALVTRHFLPLLQRRCHACAMTLPLSQTVLPLLQGLFCVSKPTRKMRFL